MKHEPINSELDLLADHPYVLESVTFLAQILKVFHFSEDQLKVSFNGGKDATVVLHLTRLAQLINGRTETKLAADQIQCIYFVEKQPFPQITEFIALQSQKFSLKVDKIGTSFAEGLKEYPRLQAVIMGTRRTDPSGKKLDRIAITDNGYPPLLRVLPILDWSVEQVWSFIRNFEIPYCELYNQGYTSLGCASRTQKNPNLKEGQCAWEAKEESERDCRITEIE